MSADRKGKSQRPRWRAQFGLRMFFVLVTCMAVAAARIGHEHQGRQARDRALARLLRLDANITATRDGKSIHLRFLEQPDHLDLADPFGASPGPSAPDPFGGPSDEFWQPGRGDVETAQQLQVSELRLAESWHNPQLCGAPGANLAKDRDVALLSHFPEISSLTLDVPEMTDRGMVAVGSLKQLRHLSLSCPITDVGLGQLSGLTRLESLEITSDGVHGTGLAHLVGNPALQRLSLHSWGISDAGLEILSGLSGITSLSIDNESWRGGLLTDAAKQHNLLSIALQDCGIFDDGLGHLRKLTALEELSIRGSRIRGDGLAALAGNTKLRNLRLSGSGITEEGLASLAALPQLRSLQVSGVPADAQPFGGLKIARPLRLDSLSMSGPAATPATIRSLCDPATLHTLSLSDCARDVVPDLPSMPNLRELFLRGECVHDGSLSTIVSWTNLEELRLDGCESLTDAGLASLSGLRRLRRLELHAYGNSRISDDGFKTLGNLANLEFLEVSGVAITDRGLEGLKGMKQLQTMWLSGTKTTEEGMIAMFKALPGCSVGISPSWE